MDHRHQAGGLRIDTTVDHEVTHLVVRGEIDVATAGELKSAGQHALAAPGVRTLGVEMSAVTFMSASGVAALVAIRNDAQEFGQVVIVVNGSRCVLRILELTALTDVFLLTDARPNPQG